MIALHLKALSTRHYGRVILSSKFNKVTCDLQVRSLHQIKDRQVEEIRIPVPWGHIAGKWWGPRKDTQPVLALHGLLDNANTFDPLMSLLPPELGVLAIDMPGVGLSSHYPSGCMYHFTQDIVTIRRIIQYFKWNNISIMGHSMGSTYAFLYAACFPDQVDKILGFDILRPYYIHDDVFIKTGGKDIDGFINLLKSDLLPSYKIDDLVERQYEASKKSIDKDSCRILLKRGSTEMEDGLVTLTRDIRLKYYFFYHSFSHLCLLELAKRVQCKVVNIKAKDGFYYEKSEYYKQTLNILRSIAKNVEYFEVEGTHHVHLNNPENVVDLVTNFLFHDNKF